MFNEPATVIFYGKVVKWKRRGDAIDFFFEARYGSEGHERERYERVLMDLLDEECGYWLAWDGCEIPEGYERILEARA